MSKIKMRCISCGKWFQSANAKEVTCPDCVQKARKEKMATKASPSTTNQTPGTGTQPARVVAPPPKPKQPAGSSSHWLDSVQDVKIGQPEAPQRPKLPPTPPQREKRPWSEHNEQRGQGGPREESGRLRDREERIPGAGNYRGGEFRGANAYPIGGTGTIGPRPRQPMEGIPGRGPRPGEGHPHRPYTPGQGKPEKRPSSGMKKKLKAPPEPKPKREKIPPPKPFEPTPEQIQKVEQRYQELAVPAEFDGIRTQIAKELEIPKTAVKKIIKNFREQAHIPSWWEVQTYKGSTEELEKIKATYEPYLPVPPVGVHKKIADELSLKPGVVYQAIKAIRQELSLPQFNDPMLHSQEMAQQPVSIDNSNGSTEETAPSVASSDGIVAQ